MDKRIQLIAQLQNLLDHSEDMNEQEIADIKQQLEDAKNN